jgi:hypothetical protein
MDATTYLQAELRKAERSFRIAAIAMAVVLVVFVGYFQWMKSALAEVLRPASVAELLVNQTRAALPEISDSLKANLTREAPEVVDYVLHRAVDEVLPLVGQSFQDNLTQYSREVNELASGQVMSAFEGTLLAYKTDSKLAKNQDPKVFATHLSAHVEAELAPQMDSVAKDAIKSRLNRSGETLKHINTELASLAYRGHGDRESEMGKSLITTWWTFLDRGRPKIPGSDIAANEPPRAVTTLAK